MTRFAASVAAVMLIAAPAAAQPIESGTLDCDIAAGIGMIIASTKRVDCVFTPTNPNSGPREAYVGSLNKVGIDIGATARGRMVWIVYAPTNRSAWALSGTYVGGSADASVVVGGGANVLVGGSNRTISLQPLSIQAQTGVNVAAGVTELDLRPATR